MGNVCPTKRKRTLTEKQVIHLQRRALEEKIKAMLERELEISKFAGFEREKPTFGSNALTVPECSMFGRIKEKSASY